MACVISTRGGVGGTWVLVTFWENVIFAIPTKSLSIYAATFKNGM